MHNEAVVKGLMTPEQEQRIWKSLQDGEFFIPPLVGLPEERFASETEDDHPYFEFQNVSHTNKPAACDMDVEELVKAFEKYAENWETVAAIGINASTVPQIPAPKFGFEREVSVRYTCKRL